MPLLDVLRYRSHKTCMNLLALSDPNLAPCLDGLYPLKLLPHPGMGDLRFLPELRFFNALKGPEIAFSGGNIAFTLTIVA